MAKTTNCVFCGKELTKGLFNGNVERLEIGKTFGLTCCADCLAKYKEIAEGQGERFNIKLENYKRSTGKKLSEQEIANLFVDYVQEYNNHSSGELKLLGDFSHFFHYNQNGEFSVHEFGLGFFKSDVSAKDMVKSKAMAALPDFNAFTKDDITKIEYAKVGIGDPLGLFTIAYSFNIRLNDEYTLTYKPGITRAAFIGHGFGFGYYRSAEKKLLRELENFKRIIGSDLPIVKKGRM
jgi:hypothetical protein